MPLGRWVARGNRYWLNPVVRRVAPWAPGFGVVMHQGRTSGNVYRTPVNVFRRGDRYVIALTYGPDADWVKNVLAAGGCRLRTRSATVALGEPRVYRDPARLDMPVVVRAVLRIIDVEEFLSLAILPPPMPAR